MVKYFFKHVLLIIVLLMVYDAQAEKLKTPRFAVIKSTKMNSRIGPGFDYPVIWHYWRKNMPVEIVEEYDQWCKIRDIDNDTSWVYQSLLSGSRSAIIQDGSAEDMRFLPILTSPQPQAHIISKAEQGTIVKLKSCDGIWCYINLGKISGYVQQDKLWGVYKKEIIK